MKNSGLILGVLRTETSGVPMVAIILIGILLLGVMYLLAWRVLPDRRSKHQALALLTGGAVANMLQRWHLGYVLDYIDIRPLPVFNLADLAIVTGLFLFLLLVFSTSGQAADGPPS